jgi:hypothetical protein
MAIIKEDSIFAAKEESQEGTAVYPGSATDGFVQPRIEGTEMKPERELKEREIYTGTLAAANPRLGMRGVTGSMSCEMKASGTEGAAPDYAILLESLLPDVNTLAGQVTTKSSGNTGSTLQIEDADIASFTVGDMVVVLESGSYHVGWVTTKTTGAGTATIVISPAKATGTFANSVKLAKTKSYLAADTGHKTFTTSYYWGSGGDGVRQTGAGCRTSGLTISNFTTGELPTLDFSFEGLTFTHTASTNAPYTPTFDTSLPSVVLNSKIYKDGTEINLESLELSIEQPNKFLLSTGSANGKTAGRAAGKRNITGTIKPYTDAASVANFTNWEAGTTFALRGFTANPDGTNGIALGSIVGFSLPQCYITEINYSDIDGVIVESIAFKATGGDAGTSLDVVMGFC